VKSAAYVQLDKNLDILGVKDKGNWLVGLKYELDIREGLRARFCPTKNWYSKLTLDQHGRVLSEGERMKGGARAFLNWVKKLKAEVADSGKEKGE